MLIFIWALLAAVTAYQGVIRRLAEALPVPDRQEYPWDLKWVTHPELGEVCELCQALEGKIYGKDFGIKPKLHPGCNCSLERVIPMDKIRTLEAGAVRAVKDG